MTKSDRLKNTVDATVRLSEVSMDRNTMMQEYYRSKIELLKTQTDIKGRNLVLKERSVVAKEKIAKALMVMAGIEESTCSLDE